MAVQLTQVIERLHSYKWNRRVITTDDFEDICQAEGVQIIDKPKVQWDCSYINDYGTSIIALNAALRRGPRNAIGLHCLSHYFQRVEMSCYLRNREHLSCLDEETPERDAHIIAACAVLPRTALNKKTKAEIVRDYDFCAEVLELRYAILWKFDL